MAAGRVAWISPVLGGLRSDLGKRWLSAGGRLASFEGVQQGLRVDVWIGPSVIDDCELSKRCADTPAVISALVDYVDRGL